MTNPLLLLRDTSNRDTLGHTVYTRESWADEWTEQSNVYCDQAIWRCAPAMSEAVLYYRYGYGRRQGESGFGVVNPFTLPALAFVKIEFDVWVQDEDPEVEDTVGQVYWYGLAGALIDERGGDSIYIDPDNIEQGVQHFNCVGLEWLLDRKYIVGSTYYNGSSLVDIDRALDFNGGGRNNKSAAKQTSAHDSSADTFVFTDQLATAGYWSTTDIVEYLLVYQRSTDDTLGLNVHPFYLNDPDDLLPDWDRPVVRQENKRVWRLLNDLIGRQRGFGFFVDVTENEDPTLDSINVNVFTFTGSNIAIPNQAGKNLKANPDVIDIKVDDDPTGSLVTVTDAFNKYDRVRVRGARAKYVFSISKVDGTLYEGWSSSNETTYQATGVTGTRIEKQRKALLIRAGENLRDVYERFIIGPDWGGDVNDGEDGLNPDVPGIPEIDNESSNANVWIEGLYILSRLPLRADYDYSGTNTPGESDLDEPGGFKPLEMYFLVPSTSGGSELWVAASQIQSLAEFEGDDPEDDVYSWGAQVVPDSRPYSFRLLISGRPKHIIDGFAFAGDAYEPNLGSWNWETAIATLAVEGDAFCESVIPASLSNVDVVREKLILAGDEYQLVHLAEGTVVDCQEGDLKRSTSSRYVRDDREALEDLATLAKSWYSVDRQAFSVSTQYDTQSIARGLYVENLSMDSGDVAINSVITEIAVAIPMADEGVDPDPRVVKFSSQHAELDVMEYA